MFNILIVPDGMTEHASTIFETRHATTLVGSRHALSLPARPIIISSKLNKFGIRKNEME